MSKALSRKLNKVETEKRILCPELPSVSTSKSCTTHCSCPEFAADSEQKWTSLSSSIDKNGRALEELRDILSPLFINVVKMDTGDTLEAHSFAEGVAYKNSRESRLLYDQNLVVSDICSSFISGEQKEFSESTASLFGWTLGREILYMDGKLDVKQRRISINSLNDPQSDAKVLLASIKACSEGISLIGASRVVLLGCSLGIPAEQAELISRAFTEWSTKFVHVYCPVTSKWEVDKIEQ
ncbi:hypothetical protein HAX54_051750 [Datura stramonium]|uniref:Helicase C-terminal domain-containing protein n=1 Tax=Datura stramonium TaxID=4076 RepID=A0ABS8WSP9_DATST|nr:hypothetical protein [Datura stramonium]